MPVINEIATEYADRVDFVAPAWKSDFASTQSRAGELLGSGLVQWGLDEDEDIFSAYGIPYQPVTVLIAGDRTVVEAWAGLRDEAEIRAALDQLIGLSG